MSTTAGPGWSKYGISPFSVCDDVLVLIVLKQHVNVFGNYCLFQQDNGEPHSAHYSTFGLLKTYAAV